MRKRSYMLKVLIIMSLCVFFVAGPVSAQTLYPVKTLCGYQPGNVPLLDNPPVTHGYENVKPGNYATIINLTNLSPDTQTIAMFASVKGTPPVFVRNITLNFFETCFIGCEDLLTFPGLFIDGMLIFIASADVWDVTVAYTFESQNARANPENPIDGGYGLGLGASIDVENIPGRPAITDATQKIKELIKEGAIEK